MATAYQYPFDPSGTSSVNRITNEQHVITAVNFRDYHYVIPDFAPFFEESLTIKLQFPDGSVRPLTPGVDYYLANQFLDASRACAKPIYGSISFLDTDTQGILSISYNTVGGEWNLTPTEITRILAEEMRNPRITTWEQITYLPERFPVVDHEWDLVDMVGMSSVVTGIQDVRDAILAGNGGGLSAHINNYSNPHNVTKAQVGLGNVQNYPVATQAGAQAGTSDNFYMTPLSTSYAIAAQGGALVDAHASRTDNPHGVTKAQVGLGNVANYAVSTTAEAQAGAVDTSFMTPLKTAQAIAQQVGTAFTSHINNQLNPHNVTAAQVGLFNVQNYPIATQQQALDGTDNASYMTPLRVQQLVTQYAGTNIAAHALRTDNPHNVTKAQVGLGLVDNFATATQADAQAGVSNTLFMTPGHTVDAINAFATPIGHLADMNNPHQVTADQVGAYTKVQVDTTLGRYVLLTSDWVAGKTAAQFTADVLAGKAATAGLADNSNLLAGLSVDDIMHQAASTLSGNFAVVAPKTSNSNLNNPVASANRWIPMGSVSVYGATTPDGITNTYPDTYWFVTGGQAMAASDAAQQTTQSAAYLIHAKNGGAVANCNLDITRLNGVADTDVTFGWTLNDTTGKMYVWAKVAAGYTDLSLTQLAGLSATPLMTDDTVVVEPTGITYVAPVGYATSAQYTALAQRVTDIETALNSITVA